MKDTRLHEDLFLLAMRDVGMPHPCALPRALGSGMLAELSLAGALGTVERHGVSWLEATGKAAPESELLTDLWKAVRASPRPRTVQEWAGRAAGFPQLLLRTARTWCVRGVLREEEVRAAWFFRQRRFRTLDPAPREQRLERVRDALLFSHPTVDLRTSLLVLLAEGAGLTRALLSPTDFVASRARIRELRAEGHLTGVTGRALDPMPAASFLVVVAPLLVPRC